MAIHEHQRIADRLIHRAEAETGEARAATIAEAQARATLAIAEELTLTNLITIYAALRERADDRLEHPLAELILRRSIRRRLGLFRELTSDGSAPGGGE